VSNQGSPRRDRRRNGSACSRTSASCVPLVEDRLRDLLAWRGQRWPPRSRITVSLLTPGIVREAREALRSICRAVSFVLTT
jgi:hypothetical protein